MQLNPLQKGTTNPASDSRGTNKSEKQSQINPIIPRAMEFIDEYVFGRYHPIFPILWGSTITFLGAWLIYRGAKKFYTVSDQNDFLQYATDHFYWLSIVVCFLVKYCDIDIENAIKFIKTKSNKSFINNCILKKDLNIFINNYKK